MSADIHPTGLPRLGARHAVARLRSAILQGHYALGAQLPTFDALVLEHGLSRATMQLVVRQLKEEGFVRSLHRSGLFVSETPPHLFRFGIVFPCHPGERDWNRFYGALLAESAVIAGRQPGVQIVPYFGVAPDRSRDGYAALLEEVADHRLAGLIITRGAGFLLHGSELQASGVPAVAINHLASETGGIPVVNTDDRQFMARGLAWLAQRQRRRVAVVASRPSMGATVEACAAAGLTTRPHWLCPIGTDHVGQVRVVVQLLLDYPEGERPDCMVVANDNLVEEALSTIHASGIMIGRDIDIVAHCNWPWPVESPLPIARLGFHSHHFLNHCLEAIRLRRRGEASPAETLIPALLETEL